MYKKACLTTCFQDWLFYFFISVNLKETKQNPKQSQAKDQQLV